MFHFLEEIGLHSSKKERKRRLVIRLYIPAEVRDHLVEVAYLKRIAGIMA
jgi:hypothetical protein